jgi:hypothetical protein
MKKNRKEKYADLEKKIKKLLREEAPEASWCLYLLEDKELLNGNIPPDKEDAVLLGTYSDGPAEAILLTAFSIRFLITTLPENVQEDTIRKVMNISEGDFNKAIVNKKGYSSEDVQNSKAYNALKKEGNIKNYLKSELRKRKV